jgi:multiple antibiotic resistance protein
MSMLSAIILLFLVIDPIGNIPLFLAILRNVEPARRGKIIIRELFIASGILVLFLFLGPSILEYLQISKPSLSIAGGIILFLIALGMIFSGAEKIFTTASAPEGEPFIVPLAIPAVAGPSAMATVLLLMARDPARWLDWLMALIAANVLSGIILFSASSVMRMVSHRVLIAIERLMGMILTTVAVEMFLSGLRDFSSL